MAKSEYKKCFYFIILLNIVSWILFILLDAIAEILLWEDMFLDGGLISIPCILTIVYVIMERKIFHEIRFKAKFNTLLVCLFVITVFLFGAFDFFLLSKGIIIIPQKKGFLNGIEYVFFPFCYGIISLLLGFIIKIIIYILYKVRVGN
ncbi:MAG: hypothetical protein HDR01_10420 [Lachnospiraceae bacterium]|nr:hypothetical protein [Lachnospiraceae bacterium]